MSEENLTEEVVDDGKGVDEGDMDALSEMIALAQGFDGVDKGEEEETEEQTEEVAEPTEEVAQEETPVAEPIVAELPEYLTDMEVKEETVVLDGKELNKTLAEDAINWAEKKGKAAWMNKPVSDMSEEEALAYRTVQSVSDRHKASLKVETKPSFTAEEWDTYTKAKENSPMFNKLLTELDRIDNVESKPQATQEEVKQEAKYKESVRALAHGVAEGELDEDKAASLYEDMIAGIRDELKQELLQETKSTLSREFEERAKNAQAETYRNKVLSETEELLKEEGKRVEDFALNPVDNTGMSELGHMLRLIDPLTLQPMTPKAAWKYHLMKDDSAVASEERFAFASAQPQQTTVITQEEGLTVEQMENMDELSAVLAEFEKSQRS